MIGEEISADEEGWGGGQGTGETLMNYTCDIPSRDFVG